MLSPEDEMKTFFLPRGYRVELVASEPMIEEPVLVDFDLAGRLWVVEMPAYMRDMAATGEREPLGRVSVLEDLDHDGSMDRKTIFLDHLILPRALKVLDRGVLIGEPPNLWLARDTDGDLRADTKELVTDKYGRLDANVEHNANSLLWALDNWIYTSETDIYLRLKKGAFEVSKTLARGQWGASQDDVGRIYRNSNESVLHVDLVPTPYLPGIRTFSGRAAVTTRCAVQTTKSTSCGPCIPHPASTAATRPGSSTPTAGWRPTPQYHRRRSIVAIAFPQNCEATSSSPTPPPTSSAGS